ncbi:MAG: CdvA-like protein [Ignisphaera sp.]|uniref:CdvA-like coiled-coil domain-containing protein n=1 Tax=Ignisphaera aggregans TaxID=334771 RepID=A0A7J3MZG6_9CREN
MSITIEKIATCLGQSISDVYGRKIGVVVGVYSEIDGKVTGVEIMINDSTYETIPAERLENKDDGIKVLPEWLVEAQKLERKLDILRKRIKALEELYKKNQVPQHAYKELKEKFDKEINKVKIETKSLKDVIRKRQYDIENFIIHIEKAMTNLMISYTSGELPENGFKVSADFMRYAKQTALDEKKDIEKHTSLLSKLEEELTSVLQSFEPEKADEIVNVNIQSGPIAVKVTS